MADFNAIFGLSPKSEDEINAPSVSFAWALIFQQLGGSFGIDTEGRRYTRLPEPAFFRSRGEELPSVPDPLPHERFLNGDEYRGALKLMAGLLRRVSEADNELIYAMFAAASVDERRFVPTIAEPTRGTVA